MGRLGCAALARVLAETLRAGPSEYLSSIVYWLCTGWVLLAQYFPLVLGEYWVRTGFVLARYWVGTEQSVGGCQGVGGLGCASLARVLAESARAGPSEYFSCIVYWLCTG